MHREYECIIFCPVYLDMALTLHGFICQNIRATYISSCLAQHSINTNRMYACTQEKHAVSKLFRSSTRAFEFIQTLNKMNKRIETDVLRSSFPLMYFQRKRQTA